MSERVKVYGYGCLVLACGLAGCVETPYVYRPTELATATEDGQTAARYVIPPEAPRGDVRVASRGITEVDREGLPDLQAIHVRLVISNDGDFGPWSMAPSEQAIEIPGHAPFRPTLIQAEGDPTRQLVVPPRSERTIDLFFGIPGDLDEDEIPSFSILWSVHTGQRAVTERTPFERAEIPWGPETPWVLGYYGPTYGSWYDGPFVGGSGAAMREPGTSGTYSPAFPGWAR